MEMLGTIGAGLVIFVGVAVLLLIGFLIFSTSYKTASPDESLIINGAMLGKKNVHTDENNNKLKVVRGGGTFVIPILQKSNKLSLLSSKLEVSTPEVYTEEGVPVLADGTAIIKIGSSTEDIATAAEQFLGKKRETLEDEAREVLEGHLRSILGTMTVEEIYKNRDKFSQEVQKVASVDLAKMGLVIVSFTIKEVKDNNGYLSSLGKHRIAQVKRDAVIAEAEAMKETRIKRAESEQLAKQAETEREVQIAEVEKNKNLKLAEYKQEQEVARAKAEQAYALEQARLEQQIIEEKKEIEVISKRKEIQIAEQEILRQEKQYDSDIRKKAEADRYSVEQNAQAEKAREIAKAESEAEKVRLQAESDSEARKKLAEAHAFEIEQEGLAKSKSIASIGQAEAQAKEQLAEALDKYGEVAVIEMIIAMLPQLAKEISAPLANIDKVTVLDGGSGTGVSSFAQNSGKMMTQVQEVMSETLGLDFSELIKDYVGNKNIGSKISELSDTLSETKHAETVEEDSVKFTSNIEDEED